LRLGLEFAEIRFRSNAHSGMCRSVHIYCKIFKFLLIIHQRNRSIDHKNNDTLQKNNFTQNSAVIVKLH